MGPWGDAIMHELLPFIEAKFRGIGEGWARFCYGGSTGGWESLAVQLMYPDEFNVGLSSGASPALLLTQALMRLFMAWHQRSSCSVHMRY